MPRILKPGGSHLGNCLQPFWVPESASLCLPQVLICNLSSNSTIHLFFIPSLICIFLFKPQIREPRHPSPPLLSFLKHQLSAHLPSSFVRWRAWCFQRERGLRCWGHGGCRSFWGGSPRAWGATLRLGPSSGGRRCVRIRVVPVPPGHHPCRRGEL